MTNIKTIGKVIVVLAFITSLNPYFLIFAAPIFIIGTILIWFSKTKILTKTLWTFLPILLWYPSFHLFWYLSGTIGTATAQKLDFIFPSDFEGKAIIIEKMHCGQTKQIINNREQLYIPKNGVLLYQGELNGGYVNHKYYKLNSNGQRIEIPERANYMYFDSEIKKPNSVIIGAWLIGTGKKTMDASKPNTEYSYMDLLVSSKDSSEKYYEFNYAKKFEELADSLVQQCK